MRKSYLAAAMFSLLFTLAGNTRAESLPEWVAASLESPNYKYDKGVAYVVLLDERLTTIREDGKAETRSRYVARILTPEGRAAARREIQYDSEMRITDLQAWHVRADRRVFELDSEKVSERAIPDDLYSDIRSKVMRFGEVEIGSVVAFEWVQKEKQLVNQDFHFFQTRAPVVASRYQLDLPPGWRVEARVYNHDGIKAQVTGNSHVWQLQNLPAIIEEPWMPLTMTLSPYLAVSYFPRDGPVAKKSFTCWPDVSGWADRLMRRTARDPKAVESKARELTKGMDGEADKVRAISQWVQKHIRYVSIQLGVISGYQPNAADVVLKKGYGDCKDKSALVQAMLQAVGVRSYLTLVFSDDPTRVQPDFHSPLQFNHAIVAILGQAGVKGAQPYPRFGHMLFFDPTDSVTPLGDLPFYLQGSYGLVVKEGLGDLIRLPVHGQEFNRARRQIRVEVQPTGEVSALINESLTGQLASVARSRLGASNAADYEREIAGRVAREMPGATIENLRANRVADIAEPFVAEYVVKASSFGNRLGRLLVFRPILTGAQNFPVFPQSERRQPILFDVLAEKLDVIRVKLPAGFRLDEIPKDVELKTEFGQFSLTYAVGEGELLVNRRLIISRQLIPPRDYPAVKKFFDTALAASQSSVVLVSQ